MERRVVFFAYVGPGAESAEGFIVPSNWTNKMLDDEAWQFGVDFAESYGVYQPHEDDENDEEGLHGYNWEDVVGYWEEYDAKKHDDLITYGSSNKPNWNRL